MPMTHTQARTHACIRRAALTGLYALTAANARHTALTCLCTHPHHIITHTELLTPMCSLTARKKQYDTHAHT